MQNTKELVIRTADPQRDYDRLAELYGDNHSCKFLPALPHGLRIEIRIPFETES